MKNIRVGLKIGLGFAVLIGISCALGAMAVISMRGVQTEAVRLDQEYIPEVDIANSLERHALLTMYAMRGYSLSYNEKFREEAKTELSMVLGVLEKARSHSEKYPRLVKLKEDSAKEATKVAEYMKLAQETETKVESLADIRKKMDAAAAQYVGNTLDLLKNYKNQLAVEVKNGSDSKTILDDIDNVNTLQSVLDLGNDTRIKNFKGQASRDAKLIEEAIGNFKSIFEQLNKLKENNSSSSSVKDLDGIQQAATTYKNALSSFLDATKSIDDLNGKRGNVAEGVLAAAEETVAAGLGNTQKIAGAGVSDLSSASSTMIAGLVVALVLGVVIAVYLTRLITRPLSASVAFADQVAGGDLEGRLDVVQADEVGMLADSLRKMVSNLKARILEANAKSEEAAMQAEKAQAAMVEAEKAQQDALQKRDAMLEAASRLQRVAEVTTSASEELSAQIEQSTRGAEQQAVRISETATAMEEMNSTVLEVARSASLAAQTSDAARRMAQDGAKVVGQVVEGIAAVQQNALGLKADMGALGKQAEDIGTIMNVISDIADQTNLLALNAAIEAARAGDAGRGFAVVADEVRKLAEKTMTATKEVGEAISGIQGGTRKNMENVDRAVKIIDESTELAKKSGESLDEIVQLVDTASDQVRSIATASEQQSSTSEEINRSVEEVSTISAETSQAMGQASQAVGELANQTADLKRLIEEMQSDDATVGRGATPAIGSHKRLALN